MRICGYISRPHAGYTTGTPFWPTKGFTLTFGSCAGLDNSSKQYVMFKYHGQRLYEERGALAKGQTPRRTSSEKRNMGIQCSLYSRAMSKTRRRIPGQKSLLLPFLRNPEDRDYASLHDHRCCESRRRYGLSQS